VAALASEVLPVTGFRPIDFVVTAISDQTALRVKIAGRTAHQFSSREPQGLTGRSTEVIPVAFLALISLTVAARVHGLAVGCLQHAVECARQLSCFGETEASARLAAHIVAVAFFIGVNFAVAAQLLLKAIG
jgi:hypothetical protein